MIINLNSSRKRTWNYMKVTINSKLRYETWIKQSKAMKRRAWIGSFSTIPRWHMNLWALLDCKNKWFSWRSQILRFEAKRTRSMLSIWLRSINKTGRSVASRRKSVKKTMRLNFWPLSLKRWWWARVHSQSLREIWLKLRMCLWWRALHECLQLSRISKPLTTEIIPKDTIPWGIGITLIEL